MGNVCQTYILHHRLIYLCLGDAFSQVNSSKKTNSPKMNNYSNLLCRKKQEACRGSEFAPRILADHGIPVVMKVRALTFSFLFYILLLFVQTNGKFSQTIL